MTPLARVCAPLILAVGTAAGALPTPAWAQWFPESTQVHPLPTLASALKLSVKNRLTLAAQLLRGKNSPARDMAVKILIPMVEGGNRPATRLLASAVGKNPDGLGDHARTILKAFSQEALHGSGSAIFAAARMYDLGIGTSVDHAKAVTWYRWAAVRGLGSAVTLTALSFVSDPSVPRNVPLAIEWAHRLAPEPRSSLLLKIATALYDRGTEDERHLADALCTDIINAKTRYALSAAILAQRKSQSADTLELAQSQLKEAAAAGDEHAATVLAMSQTDASSASSVKIYLDLATKGNSTAIDHLIAFLRGGDLPPELVSQTVLSVKDAADHGNIAAQKAMGQAYAFGTTVPVSFSKSHEYYSLAASAGDAEAAYQVGMMYLNGAGVSADQSKAKSWLEKSAAAGSKLAAAMLGAMER